MAHKPVFIQGSFNFGDPAKQVLLDDKVPWISVSGSVPFFKTGRGDAWIPIGQNDGITWPDMAGAFRCRDLAAVESYFVMLCSRGVNCLRLMLEYCQGENRYLEKPVGYFQPNMIRLWDDIFSLWRKVFVENSAHSLRYLLDVAQMAASSI